MKIFEVKTKDIRISNPITWAIIPFFTSSLPHQFHPSEDIMTHDGKISPFGPSLRASQKLTCSSNISSLILESLLLYLHTNIKC